MSKIRKYDWPHLIKKFEQSGLTQSQFCKDEGINPRYFSLKLGQHRNKSEPAFIKATASNPPTEGLVLQVGQCKVICPSSMPIDSFVMLVRSLA